MGLAFIRRRFDEDLPTATINVYYPSGSSCTCTRVGGGSPIREESISGGTRFIVPAAEAGTETWTVRCTNGQKEATQTVTISAGQTKTVTLLYELWLIKNGVIQSGISFTLANGSWDSSESEVIALFPSFDTYYDRNATASASVSLGQPSSYTKLRVEGLEYRNQEYFTGKAKVSIGSLSYTLPYSPTVTTHDITLGSISGNQTVTISSASSGAESNNPFSVAVIKNLYLL